MYGSFETQASPRRRHGVVAQAASFVAGLSALVFIFAMQNSSHSHLRASAISIAFTAAEGQALDQSLLSPATTNSSWVTGKVTIDFDTDAKASCYWRWFDTSCSQSLTTKVMVCPGNTRPDGEYAFQDPCCAGSGHQSGQITCSMSWQTSAEACVYAYLWDDSDGAPFNTFYLGDSTKGAKIGGALERWSSGAPQTRMGQGMSSLKVTLEF